MKSQHPKIYLDYAATTPIAAEAIKAMAPFLDQKFGNASSLHSFGREAEIALEKSRAGLAKSLNANPAEIIFTSSATESNNLALKGFALANQTRGKHIIISTIEHDCVRNSAAWLKKQGFKITELPVDQYGFVRPADLKKAITQETILVSIIHANNEIGTIQDLAAIGKICASKNICFHTDAAQSFGKIKINVHALNIGMLTASGHKIYGPKGIALLYKRRDVRLEPLLHGGGQESGLRSGTSNIAGAVGLAKATELSYQSAARENTRLTKLRDYFIGRALKEIPGAYLNGAPIVSPTQITRSAQKITAGATTPARLANNINLRFDGIEGESLLMRLDAEGIAVSTGSACSSAKLQASPVLLALGLPHQSVHGSLRFSLGRQTTKSDLDYTLKILAREVANLRQISPFKLTK